MKWNPKPYHVEGVKFVLQNAHAGLFWSPGCGKTSVVLANIAALKMRGMFKRAIVVAPRRPAKLVWPKERDKWDEFHGLTIDVLQGTPAKRQAILDNTTADICVITPDLLGWLVEDGRLQKLNADMLVVDESSYFRTHSSKRFKIIREYLHLFRRRIILTATPAPKSYENLWSQAYILDMGGALSRYITHYRRMYFVDVARVGASYSEWAIRKGADLQINEKLRPLVLREDAVDHMDMPKLFRNVIPVELDDEAREIYDELEKKFCVEINNKEISAITAAVLSGKLRQAANGFLYDHNHVPEIIHNAKLEALQDLIDDLQGAPVLVLYEFIADRDRLKETFPQAKDLGAGISDAAADALCDEFNSGTLPILLAHPASAGHGLNLQGQAQHIVWFGPNWNLEFDEQATARVWRHGNPHDRVFVHTIVVNDSIEQDVADVLASKDRTQKALLNALKRQPLDVVVAEAVQP